MSEDPDYPDDQKVMDAISGIVGMTAREIATRAGVDIAVVQKVLRRDAHFLDNEGRRYRYANASEWVGMDRKRPLPPVSVGHSVIYTADKHGYRIEITPPKQRDPVPLTPDPEIRKSSGSDPTSGEPKPLKLGQLHIFSGNPSSSA